MPIDYKDAAILNIQNIIKQTLVHSKKLIIVYDRQQQKRNFKTNLWSTMLFLITNLIWQTYYNVLCGPLLKINRGWLELL